MCPRCNDPFAYGQAAHTRMFSDMFPRGLSERFHADSQAQNFSIFGLGFSFRALQKEECPAPFCMLHYYSIQTIQINVGPVLSFLKLLLIAS